MILNSIGQIIFSNEYVNPALEFEFHKDDFMMSKGIYFIQIDTKDDTHTDKVMVE